MSRRDDGWLVVIVVVGVALTAFHLVGLAREGGASHALSLVLWPALTVVLARQNRQDKRDRQPH